MNHVNFHPRAATRASMIAVFLFTGFVRADTGATEAVPKSLHLRALREAVTSGKPSAVETFWREVGERGTPLVDPMPEKPGYIWLTFLWRGDDKTENVVLVGGVAVGHPADNRLTRMPGTDVWALSLSVRNDLRAGYRFSVNDPLSKPDWSDEAAARLRVAAYRNDPLNPRQWGGDSLVELPGAPAQPWVRRNPEAREGKVQAERVSSSILGNERQVTYYLPPGYAPKAPPYPVLYLFDRTAFLYRVPTPTILNNLISAKKIPPIVAVLIDNPPGARSRELPCDAAFARFLAEELVPRVRKQYNVSADPRLATVAGSSYGGLASSYFALRHPELAGNVLSMSGSYWWGPRADEAERDPAIEREWLTRQYAVSPRKAVRFFLDVGLREGMVVENRHFRDVLEARGYEVVRYSEFNGGHEYLNWRGSLAEGLIALLGEKRGTTP